MGTTAMALLSASGSTVGVERQKQQQQQQKQLLQVHSSAANSASVSPTPTLVGLVGADDSVEDDDTRLRPPTHRGDQTTESSFDDDEGEDGEVEKEEEQMAQRPDKCSVPVATVVERCQTSDRLLSSLDGEDVSSPPMPTRPAPYKKDAGCGGSSSSSSSMW
uniref:Uncharacterized protein n=1 Tax=Anopheles stephensi TaxID=30069 RepID=A0A182XYG7_ANOST